MITDETRIGELTCAELRDFIKSCLSGSVERRTVKGCKALAQTLGISLASVNRYRAAGIFDGATKQIGKTIIFDLDKINQLIKTKKYGRI